MSGTQVSATYNKHRLAALNYRNCMTTINYTKRGDLQLFSILHKLFDTRLQHCHIWSVSVSLLHLSCYSLSRNVPRKLHLFLFSACSFILTSVVSLLWHTCAASLFLPRVPLLWEEATWAKYWMTFFVFSVFPAPDSPLEYTKTHTHRKPGKEHTYIQ